MRIGIIGTGRIAFRFVAETDYVEGLEVKAVYNPHPDSAKRFVDRVRKAEKLEACEEWENFIDTADAVYIASPHETHFEYIMKALEADKHVLCEKPMVLSKDEAKKVFDYAKERDLILMEGLKTAYCPGYRKLLEVAKSGIIGEIRNIEATFTKLEDPNRRELQDVRYGGSFTELGSYVMLPAFSIAQTEWDEVSFDSIKADNGLDIFTRVTMTKKESEKISLMATLTCGLGVKSEGRLLVSGTKGYIVADAPWWKTKKFTVCFEDPTKQKIYEEVFEGDGLRYELREFVAACEGIAERESVVSTIGEMNTNSKISIAMAEMIEKFLTY